MNKKLLVSSLFTAIMSLGWFTNLATANHPGAAFVFALAATVGGAMSAAEILRKF